MVNTSQQVGGSLGTAFLSTLFASAAASYLVGHGQHHGAQTQAAALIHGYTTAFWWAEAIYAVGLAVALFVLPPRVRLKVPAPEMALAADPG
jgi:hypothetical protein